MCCFAQQVEFVKATKIFARLSDRSTQYLVYQMTFSTKTPNAMILPIPVRGPAREGSVKFINLEDSPGFFETLAAMLDDLASSYVDYDYVDPATGFVRSRPAAGTKFAEMPEQIVDPNLLVHRLRVDGYQKNQDYTFSMTRLAFLGEQIRNRLPWLIGAPLVLAASAFGWLHYRRNKLRRS